MMVPCDGALKVKITNISLADDKIELIRSNGEVVWSVYDYSQWCKITIQPLNIDINGLRKIYSHMRKCGWIT